MDPFYIALTLPFAIPVVIAVKLWWRYRDNYRKSPHLFLKIFLDALCVVPLLVAYLLALDIFSPQALVGEPSPLQNLFRFYPSGPEALGAYATLLWLIIILFPLGATLLLARLMISNRKK